MSDKKTKKIKNKKKYTKVELEILMESFDKDTYESIIQKKVVKQLGSAILSQHRKFKLVDLIMLVCGLLGGFGIASIVFGFASGMFGGV